MKDINEWTEEACINEIKNLSTQDYISYIDWNVKIFCVMGRLKTLLTKKEPIPPSSC